MAVRVFHSAIENYTRSWGPFTVDKNLQNDWLVRLNRLQCLDLIGICEGHYSCDDVFSSIVLKAKDRYKKKLITEIELVGKFLGFCRYAHTRCSAKAYFEIPDRFHQDSGREWMFTISLTSLNERKSLDMDVETEGWFCRSVEDIERIDKHLMCYFEPR